MNKLTSYVGRLHPPNIIVTQRYGSYKYKHPVFTKAFRYPLNIMQQLPLTAPYERKQWNTIQHIVKAKKFPHALS
jgi:hypothetical protein